MADPLRHDEPSSTSEGRDSRIEELLLAGLDHYFNGQHELAISVWTRVLFLDRNHARARAYIERARGAVAERQREGEELLHTGFAAFERGDAADARRLLTSAVDRGASADEALALIERLDRLALASNGAATAPPRRGWRPSVAVSARERTGIPFVTVLFVLAVGLAAGAGVMIYLDATGVAWRPIPQALVTTPLAAARKEPLPVPSTADVALSRARALQASGHLHQALDALDAVRRGDTLASQADELRAAIQGQLLAAAHAAEASTSTPPGTTLK